MVIVCILQENTPENISAEEKRLLDRLVTFGRRKGLHLPKDTQEVKKNQMTHNLQCSRPVVTAEGLKARLQSSWRRLCSFSQEIKETSKLISQLSIEFNRNLNEDTTSLEFSERELGKRPRRALAVAADTPARSRRSFSPRWNG